MRKFTDTEIDLCKKIAEKERRKITKGDYYSYQDKIYLRSMPFMETEDVAEGIKILQEHDCLEWLRKKKYRMADMCEGGVIHVVFAPKRLGHIDVRELIETQSKTTLEALLHAVLAVMEKK